jgi:hypothetical protein
VPSLDKPKEKKLNQPIEVNIDEFKIIGTTLKYASDFAPAELQVGYLLLENKVVAKQGALAIPVKDLTKDQQEILDDLMDISEQIVSEVSGM